MTQRQEVGVRDALRAAYEQGATDVHNEWLRAHEAGGAWRYYINLDRLES